MKHHQIKLEAKNLMNTDRGSHNWDHVVRVWNLCRRIGEKEKADFDILEPAAFLHDIGRKIEMESSGKICHASIGSEMARRILVNNAYPDDLINQIVFCIAAHRFRSNGVKPDSIESKVLFDADKLDAIGAVGVGRAFLFAGEVGAEFHNPEVDIHNTKAYSHEDTAYREFNVKLRKIKDRMLTTAGRKIALGRHDFMMAYFDRLNEEVLGEK